MPVYDMRCPTGCGAFEDVVCSIADRNTIPCPDCGEYLKIIPPVVRTVGIVFSNELEVKQIGRTFRSNEELRQYQRENRVEIHENGSQYWRNFKDTVREKCEKSAKKQGFRDLEHKQSVAKENVKVGKSVFQH